MSYVLEIFNTTDNVSWFKVAQLDGSECNCKIHRKLNEDYSIEITYPIPPTEQGTDKSAFFLGNNARARIINLDDLTDYQTFLLTKPIKSKTLSGQLVFIVTGLHIALVAMKNVFINAQYDFQNMTAGQILTVLETNYPYGWSISTYADPTDLLSLSIGYESISSAFQKILDACRGEADFIEIGNYIKIKSYGGLGSATKYINIMVERNLKSVSMQKYSRDIVNKIYGIGGGSPPYTIAGARHTIASIVGQVITMTDNKIVPENDSWNAYKAKFATGALAGTSFVIADSAHGATQDTLTLTGDISTAIEGDKVILATSADVEVDFIRAGVSIALYDTIEDGYKNPEHGGAVNLLKTGFFDGTYTSGLCANWTKTGTPTCTENTNAAYIQHGNKSQKVVGSAEWNGVYQDVVGLTIGKYYRIKANVYLEGATPATKINVYLGSVDAIPISDDIESDTTGKWVSFDWWGMSGATTTRITVCQIGAESATFYPDAVQISECPENEQQNYTSNCESKTLWDETFMALMKKKDPVIEYKCNFVDLNKMDPITYPWEEINLGDTVTITDTDLGLSNVAARVKELNIDPFRPELTEHIVSNI